MRYKVAVRFVIEGDLRFISHHDTMRLFERALSRAGVPVRFTQGFNPRPRFSLALPRPVGVAGQDELLVVELTESIDAEEFRRRLAEQMPEGLRLTEALAWHDEPAPQAELVSYAVPVSPEHWPVVTDGLKRLLAAASWPVERPDRPGQSIDLRAYLAEADLCDGTLRWTALVKPEGTTRPGEFLTAVGLDPRRWLHLVTRTRVFWRAPLPPGAPRPSQSAPPTNCAPTAVRAARTDTQVARAFTHDQSTDHSGSDDRNHQDQQEEKRATQA